ncbi:MAG TPA: Uma2 family endonuclease [Pirellulales bacterium]
MLGRYFPDGVFVTNDDADLASQPDGTFASHSGVESNRVRLVEGEKEGYLELTGSPDMVLEVVSASSLEKDTQTLSELYWQARITEYWLGWWTLATNRCRSTFCDGGRRVMPRCASSPVG